MFTLKAIGTDTEVFVVNKADHRIIPVVGLVGGTKKDPRPLDNLGSAVQEDNVMLEFNTIPAKSAQEFVANIDKVLSAVTAELLSKGLAYAVLPSHSFAPEELRTPQAQEIGCESDFNAWRVEENIQLSARRMKNLRTCGGHIHVSFDNGGKVPSFLDKINLVRAFDVFLGLPSVFLDLDNTRRKYYGRPGAMRFKAEDRIEYRTLSNFWISTPEKITWVFNQVNAAMEYLNTIKPGNNLWFPEDTESIIKTVATGNKREAMNLIQKYKVGMPNA